MPCFPLSPHTRLCDSRFFSLAHLLCLQSSLFQRCQLYLPVTQAKSPGVILQSCLSPSSPSLSLVFHLSLSPVTVCWGNQLSSTFKTYPLSEHSSPPPPLTLAPASISHVNHHLLAVPGLPPLPPLQSILSTVARASFPKAS